MLEHRVPLEQLSLAGATPRDTGLSADAGLSIVPVIERSLLLIQARSADPFLNEVLQRQFGLDVPLPLKVNVHARAAIVWLAPQEWLLELAAVASPAACAHLADSLAQACAQANVRGGAAALCVATDVSDAFAGFDVSGQRAVDVLASGCSLDLQPRAFPVGHTARTAIAEVPAILWKLADTPAPGLFRCWVERGFAAHFASWLAESPAGW